MIPTLVVAAPASGSGKTTVVCGLAAALRRRGRDVRLFKAGPDFLDPTWHEAVTGRPSRTLDGWMTGREGVARSFARGASGGDLALVEGVMGLFDGRDPRGLEGSAAELALWLGAPVLLVVDASAMARSAAAVVEGFARHVPGVRVSGAIFNRVGGAGHTRLLAQAMEAVPDVATLGGLPTRADLALPERHLGLVSGALAARPGWVDALADWVEGGVDLDAVERSAAPVAYEAPAETATRPIVRIGVARDAAFHFYYEENLDRLREAGTEIVPFSPLADDALPDVDGLYIGGGYPEAHAGALAANAGMREAIRRFAGPVYGECGGLMYLGETLGEYSMCGRLPLRTRMTPRLASIGYREVVTTEPTVLGPAGTRFRGHEFHYGELAGTPGVSPVYQIAGAPGRAEGWSAGATLGTWVHAHFGSNPALAASFVGACLQRRTPSRE